MEILKDLGIDPDRLAGFRDPGFRERFGLSSSCWFDSKAWAHGFHEVPWKQFLDKTPLSDSGKRELFELYTTRKNYLAGIDEPLKALASMSWETYIREKMGLGDLAVLFSNLYATDLGGLGCDALSALSGYGLGPGFFGVGGDGFYDDGGMLRYGYEPIYRFPDGNRSLARHLVKKLLPDALEGEDTMEGVFNGELRYERFDVAEGDVRLRLRSTVVRVQHIEGGSHVVVYYATPDGSVRSVTAKGAILAAWGMAAKHIVPELSGPQRAALADYHYGSALYINVLLSHWRPVAEIGAFEMYTPGGYATWMHVLDPLRVGAYHPEYHPDHPTILSMFRYLTKPGHSAEEQMKLNRYELESKPFEEIEREVRTELERLLGPWGFDAARDIQAITVNRWGHGYIIFPHPDVDAPVQVRGRERVGHISFAGADAGGSAWSQAAFQQGHRAAHEQLALG